jgi:putative transcription antitermination factor YqgF
MTTLLGVDLGERRIGLAIGSDDGAPAQPLATLPRGKRHETDADALARIVVEQHVDEIVVGLPYEASGAEGPQAALTRRWTEAMADLLPVPLTFRDERLSSYRAEGRLGPMKRGRSGGPPTRSQRDAYRARVDREAAAIILQDELDARAGVPSARSGPAGPLETDR